MKPVQPPEYHNATEMLIQAQQTRTGNVGLFAAIAALVLVSYTALKTENNTVQQLALINFIFVELFYLAFLKFSGLY